MTLSDWHRVYNVDIVKGVTDALCGRASNRGTLCNDVFRWLFARVFSKSSERLLTEKMKNIDIQK